MKKHRELTCRLLKTAKCNNSGGSRFGVTMDDCHIPHENAKSASNLHFLRFSYWAGMSMPDSAAGPVLGGRLLKTEAFVHNGLVTERTA